jgi:hypothetical protein
MDQSEAAQAAERLNREHPDRSTHVWLVGRSGEEWAVFKVNAPPGIDRASVGTNIEQLDAIHTLVYERIPDSGT